MACCHFKKLEEVAKEIRDLLLLNIFFFSLISKFCIFDTERYKKFVWLLAGCGAGVDVGRHQEKSKQSPQQKISS